MVATSIVILAGGLGTRIGGNKALRALQERPLLEWVLQAMRPQADEVLISANAPPGIFAQYGCRVVADRISGHAGPLAGLHAAMMAATHEWIAGVPCDVPFLPGDLVARLHAAICGTTAEAAVAVIGGDRQPAVALYRTSVLQKLDAFLAGGGRKVGAWQDSLQWVEAPFEDAAAFINLNSTQELALANQILHKGGNHDDIRRAIA